MKNPGNAWATLRPSDCTVSIRKPRNDSPHGRVYGKRRRTNVNDDVDDQRAEQGAAVDEAPLDLEHARRSQRLGAGHPGLRDRLLGRPATSLARQPAAARDSPQREHPGGEDVSDSAEARTSTAGGRASCASASACCSRATGLPGDLLQRFARQWVDVGRRQADEDPACTPTEKARRPRPAAPRLVPVTPCAREPSRMRAAPSARSAGPRPRTRARSTTIGRLRTSRSTSPRLGLRGCRGKGGRQLGGLRRGLSAEGENGARGHTVAIATVSPTRRRLIAFRHESAARE